MVQIVATPARGYRSTAGSSQDRAGGTRAASVGARRAVWSLLPRSSRRPRLVRLAASRGGAERGHAARPDRLRQGARALAGELRRRGWASSSARSRARSPMLEGRLARRADRAQHRRRRASPYTARPARSRRARASNRLRERLSEVRDKLSGLLRERYMGDRPDFVTVVLHADGFPQLLETMTFVRRVERADTRLLGLVRSARGEAGREQREYWTARRAPRRREAHRRARPPRRARRHHRRPARAARAPAPRPRRPRRRARPRPLRPPQGRARAHAPARRPRPRRRVLGRSGGPWAIPWPIVQCESGGQNLPPNPPAPRATTSSCRPPGRASAARPRTPTRPPRPSRTGSRRACGPAARARTTGSARPRS